MKKLMFMLAAIVMAAGAQAASVWWTCAGAVDGNGSSASGLAYFVNAAVLSHDDALALEGKGATAIADALSGSYSFSGSSGNYGVAKASAVGDTARGLSADGGSYSVYLVLFDTATITDSSNFYVTDAKNLTALAGADDVASVKWGNVGTATSASGAWKAANVPEPTSGLLMLVGLAGLALRRRRA